MKLGSAGPMPRALGLAVVSKRKRRPMVEFKWGAHSLG